MKCDKNRCLANIKDECCVDKCEGELIRLVYPPPEDEVMVRQTLYEMLAKCFKEDFKED